MMERKVVCDLHLISVDFGREEEIQPGNTFRIAQACQEDDLTVWKFQGVVMRCRAPFVDLPKNRRLIIAYLAAPAQQAG